MFASIVIWSLRHRGLVLAFALALLVVGFDAARQMPVDVLPDLTRPTVTVQAEARGVAPEDIEAQLLLPLEAALAGLPELARLRSVAAPGLAIFYLEFAWGSDPWRNRQLVAERLEAARGSLPEGVQPRIGPLTSLMGEVLLLGLSPSRASIARASTERRGMDAPAGVSSSAESLARDGSVEGSTPVAPVATPMTLRDHADWVLRPALLAVPGVAQVVVLGGDARQYELQPDLARMRVLGVSLAELESAVRGAGRDLGAGFVALGGRELALRSLGRTLDTRELAQVAVVKRGDAIIRVGQIAKVVVGVRLPRGAAGVDGEPGVTLAVQKQPGVDTVALTAQLENKLATLDAGLPAGAQRVTLFRQADFIERSVANVRDALRDGALIAAVVLLLFLANGRATLIALTAIPLSVLGAVLVLRLAGQTLDTMTLGGLAIAVGELVDDAVIGVENVLRRLRLSGSGSIIQRIAAATVEVRSGILYATLLIVLAFAPLFALGGIEGRLFRPLGLAYLGSILASLVVAITVTPVLCALIYGRTGASLQAEPRWLEAVKAAYGRGLERLLARPLPVFVATAALTLAALAAFVALPRQFLPPFNESTLTVNLVARPGISLAESEHLGRIAERELLALPEVAQVGRRTGRAELDEHAEGIHYSELDVLLKPGVQPGPALTAAIRARLSVLPAQLAIGQPISHRLDHLLSGVRAPLVVKLYGDDLVALREAAEAVRARLAAIPGLVDVQVEAQVEVAQQRIRIDARSAAQYGIAPARAQETLVGLSLGRPLSQIVEGTRRYDFVLRLPEAQREAASIPDLLIDGINGSVPLRLIAEIEQGQGPNQLLHEDGRRRIAVSAWAADGRLDRASRAAEAALAGLSLPAGIELHVEGEASSARAAAARIAGLALLALLLMMALLQQRYRSALLTAILLVNLPLALIGGVAALAITGTPLSVASLVGFVTLAGIAARNGILKLSHYRHLVRDEGLVFGPELILRGAVERLRPVTMTALIAALALAPLLWRGAASGKEILHPVALVIFGGLLSSTLLDAFLTPLLIARFARSALALRAIDDK